MSCDSTDQRRSESYAAIKRELLERNAKTCICDCSIIKAIAGDADKVSEAPDAGVAADARVQSATRGALAL